MSNDDGRPVEESGMATVGAPAHRPPTWWGLLVGVLAAGCGLAAGEFVAGLARSLRSPVLSVGDRIIDRVPHGLRTWAIETFGTSDKTVLVWSIVIVVVVAAAAVGVATVRGRRDLGVGFAALFALAGAWAAGVGRNTRLIGVIPALAAGATAAAVLLLGHRLAHPRPSARARALAPPRPLVPGTRAESMTEVAIDRRRLLVAGGGLALGAALVASVGRGLQDRFNTSLERAGVRAPVAQDPLPAPPSDPAALAANDGLSALITPIPRFYRIDTALSFPSIALASWRLDITGMVDTPKRYTYDDLVARDLIERDITLSCVSNPVGGPLVGNARWVGCRLDDLLAESGIQSSADQVMGISVDGFNAGFPVTALDGRDAMIAFSMNGETLPVKNGFPARIVVPGLYGYVSAVKWLSEIKLTRFDADEGYWVPRGWDALAPVKTQSRIDRPRSGIDGGPYIVAGVAWAPTRGITQVEVQVDNDAWQPATLGPSLGDDSWRQWWLEWDAAPGRHRLRVRATDGDGELQPEPYTAVAPNGATGWHTVFIQVDEGNAEN